MRGPVVCDRLPRWTLQYLGDWPLVLSPGDTGTVLCASVQAGKLSALGWRVGPPAKRPALLFTGPECLLGGHHVE